MTEKKQKQQPAKSQKKAQAKTGQKKEYRKEVKSIQKEKAEQMKGKTQTNRIQDERQNRELGIAFWETVTYMPINFELKTPYTQQSFKRLRRSLAINCYLAEAYPSIEGWKHWAAISRCIDKLINDSEQQTIATLQESVDQAMHTAKMLQMIDPDTGELKDEYQPQFINTKSITYAITTPRVRRFIDLYRKTDEQIQLLNTLWITDSGIDANYVRHESLRLRSNLNNYAASIFRQSDRIRRVLKHKATPHSILEELQEEVDKHFGAGLKKGDEDGDSMLLDGEEEASGALVGEKEQPAGEKEDAMDEQVATA